jgi:hypothetical protein
MAVLVFSGLLGLDSGIKAQNEIPLRRVPKAVTTSAKAKFPGAKIKVASEKTDDGKPPVFALEMTHNRRNVDVTFTNDGAVVLVETAVPAKELPKAVRRAVEHTYPGATIRGAESVKEGPDVKKQADYYRFYLVTADETSVVVKVDHSGKVLDEEMVEVKKRERKGTKKG